MLLLKLCNIYSMPHVLWELPILVILPVVSSTATINHHFGFIIRIKSAVVTVNPRILGAVKLGEIILLFVPFEENWACAQAFQFVLLIRVNLYRSLRFCF